jgi:cytosine deaminase
MIKYPKGLWYQRLNQKINEMGGMFNAHLHLDRAGTLDEVYMDSIGFRILDTSHISLHKKHSLITNLHQGRAYQKDDFYDRVNFFLDEMVASNTYRADTLVDVTTDGVGLSALEWLMDIKSKRSNEISLNIGAYSPFGFDDDFPEAWDLFEKGAHLSDFIAALPEADDINEYPSHIGFDEHCKRMLLLAKKLNKPLHVHVDQRNEPSESGTERLIEAVKEFGGPKSIDGIPMIWAVHLISPSTYTDERFNKMIHGMLDTNIGMITCPSAAIGMRQYRPIQTPTYNSIPRILEMLASGIHVRMGSDNISDICSPSTTANLIDELFVLSAAVRFYNPEILAKIAAGIKLEQEDKDFIINHLKNNEKEMYNFINSIK